MSERGGAAGTLVFIGIILIVNLLSWVFNWGFIIW